MRKLYEKRLKGSSLPEVLVALAIMTVATTLATVIYLHIQKSSLCFFRLKAVEMAEEELKESERTRNYSTDTKTMERFTIKKTLSVNEVFPDCYTLRIVVFDPDKTKICDLSTVVLPQ